MKSVYKSPESLTGRAFHYCAGCSHGVVHRLIAEVIDELKLREQTVGIAPVGCAVMIGKYFNFDVLQAAHGRAPAVATGVKRVVPENLVFTYQGDGDLASIGMSETVHCAIRGEQITIIFVNNACYGMTGGQMAPTTLPGQITTTTPEGRKARQSGYPVRIPEMLVTLEGVKYLERVSVHSPAHVTIAKRAIKKAFTVQMRGLGFSLVEIISVCPTNWRKTPLKSMEWLIDQMLPVYPLGVIKEPKDVLS